jgi:hypothetical protein
MSSYSDAQAAYADFQSAGRYFAWAMATCLVIGVTATYMGSGHSAGLTLSSVDLVFVAGLGYVALGLSAVLAAAAAGSLLITHQAKVTITVSPAAICQTGQRNGGNSGIPIC